MSIEFSEQQVVTETELLREARTIAKKIFAWRKSHPNDIGCLEFLPTIQREHKKLSDSYPLVIRYMTLGEYKEKAFSAFIKWIQVEHGRIGERIKPISDPQARMEALEIENLNVQAEYVVFLFKYTKPHYTATHISNLRKNIRDALYQEQFEFKEAMKQSQGRVEELEKILAECNKDETKEYYKSTRLHIIPEKIEVVIDPEISATRGGAVAMTVATAAAATTAAATTVVSAEISADGSGSTSGMSADVFFN